MCNFLFLNYEHTHNKQPGSTKKAMHYVLHACEKNIWTNPTLLHNKYDKAFITTDMASKWKMNLDLVSNLRAAVVRFQCSCLLLTAVILLSLCNWLSWEQVFCTLLSANGVERKSTVYWLLVAHATVCSFSLFYSHFSTLFLFHCLCVPRVRILLQLNKLLRQNVLRENISFYQHSY